MKHFAFILGRESKLSLAEILQVLNSEGFSYNLVSHSDDLAIIDSKRTISPVLFHKLGGSIKLAELFSCDPQDISDEMEKRVRTIAKPETKVRFGISVYPSTDGISRKMIDEIQNQSKTAAMMLKRELKNEGLSARFVESKDQQLSSVVVKKNFLMKDSGIEIIIALGRQGKAWVGHTVDVQDFEAFASRDHARPYRDDRSGMLPPKLARIMINLAGKKLDKDTVLLDPFCGSGTVLQEAAILGAGKVIGSDISQKAVDDSVRNLSWLANEINKDFQMSVDQVDVTEIASWLPEKYINLIVTEPYLGDPTTRMLTPGDIKKRNKELSDLYGKGLTQMHKVLKDDGIIVMIFPFIDKFRTPLPKQLTKKFEVVEINEDLSSTERKGIDYKRPNQYVGREILVLRKK